MSAKEDRRVAAGTAGYRRVVAALFCAGIATFAQVYAPQGLLPEIARDFEVSASASSLALGATTIGIAVGVLPWGRLSDRIGRVRAMRWAILLALTVSLTGPFVPNFEMLVTARFIEGLLLAGLPAIAVTALAETVKPLALGGAVGAFVGGNTIGGLTGRFFAAVVGEATNWHWGLFTVSAGSTVIAIVFVLLMPPTVVKPGASLPLWRATVANLRNPAVLSVVALAFLLMGGFVAAFNYLTFRLQQPPFGLSIAQIAPFFLAYLAGAVSSRLVWRIVSRFSEVPVLLGGIGVMLLGLCLMLTPSIAVVAIGLVILTGGFFGAHSIALTLSGQWADPGGRSLAPSLYNLGYYSGSTLLGWAGGLAFAAGGWAGTVAMIALCAIASGVIVGGTAAWRRSLRSGQM